MEHFLIWTPIIFPRGPNAPSGSAFCYSRSEYSSARILLSTKASALLLRCPLPVRLLQYGHCNIQDLLFELRKINYLACIIYEECLGDRAGVRPPGESRSDRTCWSDQVLESWICLRIHPLALLPNKARVSSRSHAQENGTGTLRNRRRARLPATL